MEISCYQAGGHKYTVDMMISTYCNNVYVFLAVAHLDSMMLTAVIAGLKQHCNRFIGTSICTVTM